MFNTPSSVTLASSHTAGYLNLLRHSVGLLWIRTHDLGVQANKAYAAERVATETDNLSYWMQNKNTELQGQECIPVEDMHIPNGVSAVLYTPVAGSCSRKLLQIQMRVCKAVNFTNRLHELRNYTFLYLIKYSLQKCLKQI
jgi:hypothetical protein